MWCPPPHHDQNACSIHSATGQLGLESSSHAIQGLADVRSPTLPIRSRHFLDRRGRCHCAEQPANIGGRKRPSEQIALDLVDAPFAAIKASCSSVSTPSTVTRRPSSALSRATPRNSVTCRAFVRS